MIRLFRNPCPNLIAVSRTAMAVLMSAFRTREAISFPGVRTRNSVLSRGSDIALYKV
jgi:hypothetical protein